MSEIDLHKNEVSSLCEKYNVAELYAFGSVLKPNFKLTSDIDLLVKFKPIDLKNYFSNFLSFKENLERVFLRRVDLLEQQTLRNPVLIRSIEQNKQLIYG